MPPRHLLITAVETNAHHGVGILLRRMFPRNDDFACIRSTTLYGGREEFGQVHHEVRSRMLTVSETEARLRELLEGMAIERILCVPYYREDFVHGLLAQRITGAPLCTYLMDDQNVFAPHVPDHWVESLLAASTLRLGISPEMCAVYTRKFGHELHLLPPVLERGRPLVPCYWQRGDGPLRAAMIGNVWSGRRFLELRHLLRETGLHVDWYGNGPQASWLDGTPEEWAEDNVRCLGHLPEEDLVAALGSYPFILVPSGSLDRDDDNPAFSKLSLPSRLLFLHALVDTPVVLLGSPQTSAGRLINAQQTGICAPRQSAVFRREVEALLEPERHRKVRDNIRRLAPRLVLPDAGGWLWRSLAAGRPEPAPFQELFGRDYLRDAVVLEDFAPAVRRKHPPFALGGDSLADSDVAAFAFLRNAHLDLLAQAGIPVPAGEDAEVSVLAGLVAQFIAARTQPAGGNLLFLGEGIFPGAHLPAGRFRPWRMRDLSAWQRAGYAGDPAHLVDATTGAPHPPVFPQFDAIVTTGWCSQLPDNPHDREGLALFLEACSAPGAVNLHAFPAVLHPDYFWVAPSHAFLRDRFVGQWPGLEEILETPDVFRMGEAAYERHWHRVTGKDYIELGALLAVMLFWRGRAPRKSTLASA